MNAEARATQDLAQRHQAAYESEPGRREKSRNLQPLMRLLPYMLKYRWRVVAAVISLVLAAVAMLAVPLAVRRVIDHGFTAANATDRAPGLLGLSWLARSGEHKLSRNTDRSVCARETIRLRPASKAIWLMPACWHLKTVSGPMVGRSIRKS